MNVTNLLTLLGKLDGSVAAIAAAYSVYDPAHVQVAILVSGITGAIGTALNAVANYLGSGNVFTSK